MNKRITILLLLLLCLGINIKSLAQVDLSAPAFAMAWSPDGLNIASAHGSELALWDTQSGEISSISLIKTASEETVTISDLQWLGNDYLLIAGMPSGMPSAYILQFSFHARTVESEMWDSSYVQSIEYNGDFVASTNPDNLGFFGEDAVIFWDLERYREISRINGEAIEGISGIALSPNDTQVAITTSLQGDVLIWDIESTSMLRKLPSNAERINSISWSNNGKYIVASTSALLEPIYSLIIWDTDSWAILRETQLAESLEDMVWNPVYPLLAANQGLEDKVVVFDIEGNEVASFPAWYSFSWSPDGTKIATGDPMDYTKLNIYDVCTNEAPSDEIMACPEAMDLAN